MSLLRASRDTTASRSRARTQSRARRSRNASLASNPFPQSPEFEADVLLHPDRRAGGEEGEYLSEIREDARSGGDDGYASGDEGNEYGIPNEMKPWWRRPSPWWPLAATAIATVARSMTTAPRVEVFIQLVCDSYMPDATAGEGTPSLLMGDSDKWKHCASDPVVQAAVAKLALAMTSSVGLFGCLTTAWWGSLSDRYGRTRILGIAIVGLLMEDVAILVVGGLSPVMRLPFGYWTVLFGPIISGMVGGVNTVAAGVHAYIADTTNSTSRSRFFSLSLGSLFLGFSLGPTLGSLLISYTGSTLSVFFVSLLTHALYSLAMFSVIPESLSRAEMTEIRHKHAKEAEEEKIRHMHSGVWRTIPRKIFGFLRPLGLLVPSRNARGRRNWSLLLLAAGYGCTTALRADVTYEFQYLAMLFGWSSKQLGYYTSVLGTTRAIYLTVLLPIVMKLIQPTPPAVQLPTSADEPLRPSRSSSAAPLLSRSRTPASQRHADSASPTHDLTLARISLVIEIIGYSLMAMTRNGYVFAALGAFSALGIGFAPAVHSVSSALYIQEGGRELGKLFGAFGVVQTISSQVVGPFLFGVTYMRTVATFPQAIFVVTVAALITALAFLATIRLHKPGSGHDVEAEHDQDQPLLQREETYVVSRDASRGRKASKASTSST